MLQLLVALVQRLAALVELDHVAGHGGRVSLHGVAVLLFDLLDLGFQPSDFGP